MNTNMKRFLRLSLIAFALCDIHFALAGPEPIAVPESSKVVLPTEMDIPPVTPWFGAEVTGADPLGMDHVLFALEGFMPLYQNRHNLFFGFARGILSHNFDDDDPFRANNELVEALAAELEETVTTCPECQPFSASQLAQALNQQHD